MKVKANRVANFDAAKQPGDFFLTAPDADGVRRMSFICPCGCGVLCGLKVRNDGRMVDGAWAWNCSEHMPDCDPSIRVSGKTLAEEHWHGYLRNGFFESC